MQASKQGQEKLLLANSWLCRVARRKIKDLLEAGAAEAAAGIMDDCPQRQKWWR